MHRLGRVIVGAMALTSIAISAADAAAAIAPFEIVKNHIDVEVASDGSYVETRETVAKVLTEQGAQAIRQITLSYTQQFQSIDISEAYTLKANGTRVDVKKDSVLRGYGATSSPGFQDLKTQTIIFPNLEVGDQVVLATVLHQYIPWFGDQFMETFTFSQRIPTQDVTVAISAPATLPLQFDVLGMKDDPPATLGKTTRRVWHYSNAVATTIEQGAVDEFDTGPRIVVSSFRDYKSFAEVYAGLWKDRSAITPPIRELADQLTSGIKGEREQARAIYEWVSQHIAYVNIVLGAGGFIPHRASDVLTNRFGDCKDHVILLQALLAAKGIESSPVLINAGTRFSLPTAASPAAFNHLITYIPKWKLYLDSTARVAPFGVLPFVDSGKPVVRIGSRDTARTPVSTSADASVTAIETVDVSATGDTKGDSHVTAIGSPATDLRAMMQAEAVVGDAEYFRRMMGPGVDGEIDRGDVDKLSNNYEITAHYRQANAINIPGPGAVPNSIGFKPFSLTLLVANDLPATRSSPYVCPSMAASENLTLHLPPNVAITSIPPTVKLGAEGISLSIEYTRPDVQTVHAEYHLKIDHREATCSVAYYESVRETLAQMAAALRTQILYR